MVSQQDIRQLQQLNSESLVALERVLLRLDQPSFSKLNIKGNATIGQHVRHTLEFYQCLFSASRFVNYDLRKRDILLESSLAHAVQTLRKILVQLKQPITDRELQLQTGTESKISSEFLSFDLPSSIARELFYVLEHTIHHMALIRVLIKDEYPDFELEENFGVAYSTVAHREQLAKG